MGARPMASGASFRRRLVGVRKILEPVCCQSEEFQKLKADALVLEVFEMRALAGLTAFKLQTPS